MLSVDNKLKQNETMDEFIKKLESSFEAVRNVAPIAYWYENLNEEGRLKDIHFSKQMRDMLGYGGPDEFPDDFDTLKKLVHPDDFNIMLESAVYAGTGKTDKFDVQYRIRKADGDYLWCKATGQVVKSFEGKTIGMYGAFIDISEHVELQEKISEENNRLIDSFLSEFNLVYRVNLSDASFSLLKMDEGIVGQGLKFNDFTEARRFFIEEVAYISDREMLWREMDFDSIRRRLKTERLYSVEYRAVLKGVATWHEMDISSLGGDEVAIGFAIKDIELLTRHISKVLMDSYEGLYVVNLNTDQIKIIKATGITREKANVLTNSTLLRELADRLEGDDKAYFTAISDPQYHKRLLQKEGKTEFYYQSPNYSEGPVWLKCETHVLTTYNGEPETAVVGITRADRIQSDRMKLGEQLIEALNNVTEEKNRFAVAADLINSATWSFALNENDEVTRAEFFGEPIKILGVDLEIKPHSWEEILHPDDKERALKAFNATIRDHEGKTPYDIVYRMRDAEGKYNWFRSVGRIIEAYDGSREFFGVQININDRIAEQQEQQRLLHLKDFGDMVNAALWSMDIDDDNNIIGVYWSNEFRHMFGFEETEEDFANTVEAWSSRLHPEDRARALSHLYDSIKSKNTDDFVYGIDYRILKKSGEYCWYHAVGRINYNADGTRKLYGMIKDISMDKNLEEQNTITNYFLEPYISAYYVGLDDLSCHIYRRTKELDENYPIKGNFTDSLNAYIDNEVIPEDREGLRKCVLPEYMRKKLARKKEYTHTFRAMTNGEERTYFLNVIRGADEAHAAFGFRDITEEIGEQNRRIQEAEETRQLIESVASVYSFAFAVNMVNGDFKIIRLDNDVKRWIDDPDMNCYSEAIAPLFSILHPLDRERMSHELDFDTIRKKLADTHSYNIEYRVVAERATRWHEMNVTHISGDEIAMGFCEKDIEITKLHLEDNRFAEYFALYEVDIDCDTIKVIKESPFYGLGAVGSALTYTVSMKAFASSLEGESRNFFNQIADIDYLRKDLAQEGKHTYTYQSVNVGGKWVDCTSYVTYRHEDGTPAMFTLGFTYIDSHGAARQELQNQIAIQKTQLENALSMTQAANKAKTEFLFNMSHDIRTPMNAILGFTTIAEKHLDDKEKLADCLDKARQSGNLLLTLIDSVLDMSRIESGTAESEEQAGDVLYSFVSIEATLMEAASVKDIDLSFEFGDITDRYVYADFSRCLRIFTNLISNAIKYTREGGYVKVRCVQEGPRKDNYVKIRYTIEDNGIGMSQEFQRHMFEAFSREHNSTFSGIQGTGLGLSVCKTFVDYLGGTIECESEPEKGTKFTVILPFRLQEGNKYTDPITGEIKSGSEEQASVVNVDFKGKKVLIVEDNEMNLMIAQDLLGDEGLIVDSAEDGSIAVEILKDKGPDYYDFVLMDIQMPIMNGYEATRLIREMYPDSKLPIIAVSANAFEEDKRASKEAGMDEHVAKPIRIKELFKSIAKFF